MSAIISRQPDLQVCGEASGMSAAMREIRQSPPDVLVIDISLQDGSGIELVKELKAQRQSIRVLVCSMHDEMLYAERALHAGAKGYINKAEAPEKLVEAIRAVAEGKTYVSEEMTERLLCRQIALGDERARSALESLSDRELEVFEQIGHGTTTKQIAENLHLSPKTIETYRENIKQKLGLSNATQLTQHAVHWVLNND